MTRLLALPRHSLRVKLVLSYLLVALGAVLILAFAVSIAVQNYFENTQRQQVHIIAQTVADSISARLSGIPSNGDAQRGNFSGFPFYNPFVLIVVNAQGIQLVYAKPERLAINNADIPAFNQALQQALKGQNVDGRVQGTDDASTLSGYYSSTPIRDAAQGNGQIIGAVLIAMPERYPKGLSPGDFILQTNQAIFFTGIALSIAVIIFSFLMARSLTKPLASLTAAAEQMKQGQYTQRAILPKSLDELGQLALTFNAMADTIEADVNELRRQDQARRDLIANISHDLATPLTAIQGFSEALADNMIAAPDARYETAQLIGREVQRLRRLVADMQNMTALESGRILLDLAPLDMHALVDETLAVIEPECEQASITLHNQIPADILLVQADSDRITQVLLNLLDNARRHTSTNGSISVGAKVKEKTLVVTISDTGVGISPADLPHIFDRFYRADHSRTGATGGSGLGLAIVKAIITAHGGSIGAESTLGQGTFISFTLPLVAS